MDVGHRRRVRVAALAWLPVLLGCETPIVSGVDEQQANEILVALTGSGIPATKEAAAGGPGGDDAGRRHRVMVAAADLPAGLEVLRSAALPRPRSAGLEDVFDGSGLVPTPTEERARLAAAYGGELARTLETLPGILRARVHVALPDERAGRLERSDPPAAEASVLLLVAAGPEEESALGDDEIAQLVAGAVDGLEAGGVAVVRASAPASPTRVAPGPPLEAVGPVVATATTAPTLRGVLVTGLALLGLLAGLLVWALRRGARREARLEALLNEARRGEPGSSPGSPAT